MSCFITANRDFLSAILENLPERIIRHSERVRNMACLMAGHVPDALLPENTTSTGYRWSLSEGAYYHDIGVYLAGNNVECRPLKGEVLLREHWQTSAASLSHMIVLEAVRNCRERVDGSGYPPTP